MSSLPPSAIKFVETECSRSDAEKCITETSAALLGHPQGVLHLVSSAPNIIFEAGHAPAQLDTPGAADRGHGRLPNCNRGCTSCQSSAVDQRGMHPVNCRCHLLHVQKKLAHLSCSGPLASGVRTQPSAGCGACNCRAPGTVLCCTLCRLVWQTVISPLTADSA